MDATAINLLTKVILQTASTEDFLSVSSIPNDLWDLFSASSSRQILSIFGLKPLRGHSDFTIDEVTGNENSGRIRYRVYYDNFEGEVIKITHNMGAI
jgi:hypothetical protein